MLNDNWNKLLMRLQAIANSEIRRREDRPGQIQNAAIIAFKLYFRNGELIGWSRPERTPLEPCPFDITILELQTFAGGWNGVFIDLKRECRNGANPLEKALVIRENGEPAGWFADRVKVGV